MNIQALLEGSSSWTSRQIEAQKNIEKWAKTGLLKNLNESRHESATVSTLLQNQLKQLMVESNITGGNTNVAGGSGESWNGIALPLVRRIFGEIVAKEFLSVQSMSMPSGLVFYLDFKYSAAGNLFNGGTTKKGFGSSSLYGSQADQHPNVQNVDVSGGLYGTGRFGYSLNQFSASVTAATASVTLADFNFDTVVSASAAGLVKKITFPTTSIADFDPKLVRGIVIESGSVDYTKNLQQFTELNNGTVSVLVKDATAAAGTYTVFYNKATTIDKRGDFEDGQQGISYPNANSSTSIAIPSMDIKLKSESLVAETRKLKAQWTPEFATDLNAYQSLDAEKEITDMISNYVAMEIDLELLEMLINDAATTGYWSAINNEIWNGTTFITNPNPYFNQQGTWYQTLGNIMNGVSNKIHQKTLRSGANFAVVSPAVATVIESIPGFASDASPDKDSFNFGIQKHGVFASQFKIYKNPYLTENVILMGYKGAQFLETGAVYAPYVPLVMTPVVYDPETFTPRKGLMTRYAKKMVRPEFYGKIYVKGLETVGFSF